MSRLTLASEGMILYHEINRERNSIDIQLTLNVKLGV